MKLKAHTFPQINVIFHVSELFFVMVFTICSPLLRILWRQLTGYKDCLSQLKTRFVFANSKDWDQTV